MSIDLEYQTVGERNSGNQSGGVLAIHQPCGGQRFAADEMPLDAQGEVQRNPGTGQAQRAHRQPARQWSHTAEVNPIVAQPQIAQRPVNAQW
ncbi:hypothetical protein [Saccharopolyspora spinosa]|uniref:hypothetical protein n=1 Tax=Saccharopolyspora spinosa TaxID=60894 RepID=UPI00117B2DF2|nr:hypothetical protein [Saccharopolyspora spinosa]